MYLGLAWCLPFQGFVLFLWLLSGGPVVGYASLAFVPHVSSGTLWAPLLLYILPHGCPPLSCCDASPRLFRLQPHSRPF